MFESRLKMKLINKKTLIIGNRKFKVIEIQRGYDLYVEGGKFYVEKLIDPCEIVIYDFGEEDIIFEILKKFKVTFFINSSDIRSFTIILNNHIKPEIFEIILEELRKFGYKTFWNFGKYFYNYRILR